MCNECKTEESFLLEIEYIWSFYFFPPFVFNILCFKVLYDFIKIAPFWITCYCLNYFYINIYM